MSTTGYLNPQTYGLKGMKAKRTPIVTSTWDDIMNYKKQIDRTGLTNLNLESSVTKNPSLQTAIESEAVPRDNTDYNSLINSFIEESNMNRQSQSSATKALMGPPEQSGDHSFLPTAKETDVSGAGPQNFMEAAAIQSTIDKTQSEQNWAGIKALPGIVIPALNVLDFALKGPISSLYTVSKKEKDKNTLEALMEKPNQFVVDYPEASEGEYNTIGAGGEFSAMAPGISPAEAQALAAGMEGGGGEAGGGCCFIFIASHGFLHPIVRKYRDKHMNTRNRRGYYWLADRLVPWMIKSKAASWLVEWLMVRPMTCYGKYYYNLNKIGAVYATITMFWLMIFSILGMRPPYTRKGTQEVV